jgi:hypothetical protein
MENRSHIDVRKEQNANIDSRTPKSRQELPMSDFPARKIVKIQKSLRVRIRVD